MLIIEHAAQGLPDQLSLTLLLVAGCLQIGDAGLLMMGCVFKKPAAMIHPGAQREIFQLAQSQLMGCSASSI